MFHFLKAYNFAKVVASTELKTRISENLYIYFKKQNNLDSALKYHELYKSHDDSLNRENTVKEITRMELTTRFQEKENLQRLEQKKKRTPLHHYGCCARFIACDFYPAFYVIAKPPPPNATCQSK